MSKIRVEKGKVFADSIGAKTFFVNRVSRGSDLSVIFKMESGRNEEHAIYTGFSFSSGVDDVIESVEFVNSGTIDADVDYKTSFVATVSGIETRQTGLEETLARKRFGHFSNVSALSGQYSVSQIFNPIGSGVITVIEQVKFDYAGSGPVRLRLSSNILSVAPVNAQCFYQEDLDKSASEIYEGNSLTIPASVNGDFYQCTVAYEPAEVLNMTDSPLVIHEGFSLTAYPTNAFKNLSVSYIFKEVKK